MKVQVAQWGNSLAVRLPKALVDELGVEAGSELEASLRGGVLRVRPIPSVTSFNLNDLLDRITPESVPAFESWPPVGYEVIEDDYSR